MVTVPKVLRYCSQLGTSILVSLKVYRDEEENEKCARAIVRCANGTSHRLVYESQVGDTFSPLKISKFVVPELNVEQFSPIVWPHSSDLVRLRLHLLFEKVFAQDLFPHVVRSCVYKLHTHLRFKKSFYNICLHDSLPRRFVLISNVKLCVKASWTFIWKNIISHALTRSVCTCFLKLHLLMCK